MVTQKDICTYGYWGVVMVKKKVGVVTQKDICTYGYWGVVTQKDICTYGYWGVVTQKDICTYGYWGVVMVKKKVGVVADEINIFTFSKCVPQIFKIIRFELIQNLTLVLQVVSLKNNQTNWQC